MTQPPATPPPTPPKPPASEAEALAAWQSEQQYKQFAGFMNRWFEEKTKEAAPAPPKTERPQGGFFGGLFGGS